MDYSLPGFSLHGIFQAGILELVAMPSSRDLPNSGLTLHPSRLLHCRWILYLLSHQGRSVSLRFSLNEAVQIRDEKRTWQIGGP